jgi:integrase
MAILKSQPKKPDTTTIQARVCKPDGSPLHPDVLRRNVLYPVLDRLRIASPPRASGFHAFRHSVGSLINAETGNLKLAQKLLGHSNINNDGRYLYTLRMNQNARQRVPWNGRSTATCSLFVPQMKLATRLRR